MKMVQITRNINHVSYFRACSKKKRKKKEAYSGSSFYFLYSMALRTLSFSSLIIFRAQQMWKNCSPHSLQELSKIKYVIIKPPDTLVLLCITLHPWVVLKKNTTQTNYNLHSSFIQKPLVGMVEEVDIFLLRILK